MTQSDIRKIESGCMEQSEVSSHLYKEEDKKTLKPEIQEPSNPSVFQSHLSGQMQDESLEKGEEQRILPEHPDLNPAGWLEDYLDDTIKNPPENPVCVAGVSGGPDSMVLLDLLVHYGWKPVVCHVNYHKRESAVRDQKIVEEFCREHSLDFKLLEPVYTSGNFQGWARDARMDFFDQTSRDLKDVPIFLAQHMDDRIETYFLQKKRKILCGFYGIRKKAVKKKRTYIRPLLRLSKKDLLAFAFFHGIPWGLDESNLSDGYLRNQIRHHQIDAMSLLEKERWVKRIEQENEALQTRRNQAQTKIDTLPAGKWLTDLDAPFILEYWFFNQSGRHLSASQAKELAFQLQKNVSIPVQGDWIERLNDHLFYLKGEDLHPFSLVIENRKQLESLMEKEFSHGVFRFRLGSQGETIESINVTESDFPLRICTPEAGDWIVMRYGNKKLSRIFIDQKRPHVWRKSVLVLKNRANEVIFVPGTGCDRSHFSPNPSFYMVEF